jgi:hypothetical protein
LTFAFLPLGFPLNVSDVEKKNVLALLCTRKTDADSVFHIPPLTELRGLGFGFVFCETLLFGYWDFYAVPQHVIFSHNLTPLDLQKFGGCLYIRFFEPAGVVVVLGE